jgi:GxxExxY protein
MGEILYKQEAYWIIGCAMDVHRTLGPGFLEGVYADALALELKRKGIPFERERRFPVVYKGIKLERGYVADMVCYSKIILELKAINILAKREEAQLLNYLKVTGMKLGILVNFGSIGNLEWKRMII